MIGQRCRSAESVGPSRLDTNTGCTDLGSGQVTDAQQLLKFYQPSTHPIVLPPLFLPIYGIEIITRKETVMKRLELYISVLN